jgi:hypothetical protein
MNQRPDLPSKSIMMMEQICQTLTAAPLKYGVASFFTFDRQTYATVSNRRLLFTHRATVPS